MFFLTGCSAIREKLDIKEVEFWTLQLSDFAPYITDIIAEYEEMHPDVKIKWIDVPFSEGEKRALASVMSNNVPDLINMNPSFGSTLASSGALIDLRQMLKQEDYNKYLKESWDTSSINNVIFGVPWYITSSITMYNTKLLKEAGLNPDKPPKTYEELGDMIKIIKERTGRAAYMPNLTEDGKILQMFNKYDVPIVNKNRTKALFNTPKAVSILQFWVDMYTKGYIPPESLTQGHRASLEMYQAGDSAFIVTGANFLKTIKDNAPQVFQNTKVAPQVTGSNGKVDFALMNLVIPKKSKHPKEALDFALYLTNTKNQLEFCKLAPILPSTKEGINSALFKTVNSSNIIELGRSMSAKQLNNAITPVPTLKNQKDLYQIADYATQQALLRKATPEQALDNAVKEWDNILINQ